MVKLSSTPSSLLHLVLNIFKAYPAVFSQIWLLVALSSSVHLVMPWFFAMNPAYGGIVFIGFALLTWFLYTAIINMAKIKLEGGQLPFRAAFKLAKQRFLVILGSNLIFFGIGAFLMLIGFALNMVFDIIHQYPLCVFVCPAIYLYVFIMLYFAIPLIALENAPVIGAFQRSAHLVKGHWWKTFICLCIVGLLLVGFEALGILFTGEDRMLLFTGYHFFAQFIFYPLIVCATIILLNDLELRCKQKECHL